MFFGESHATLFNGQWGVDFAKALHIPLSAVELAAEMAYMGSAFPDVCADFARRDSSRRKPHDFGQHFTPNRMLSPIGFD